MSVLCDAVLGWVGFVPAAALNTMRPFHKLDIVFRLECFVVWASDRRSVHLAVHRRVRCNAGHHTFPAQAPHHLQNVSVVHTNAGLLTVSTAADSLRDQTLLCSAESAVPVK